MRLHSGDFPCGSCGKRRFATLEAAEQILRHLQDTGGARGERSEDRVYEAHGWFHITSEPKRGLTGLTP